MNAVLDVTSRAAVPNVRWPCHSTIWITLLLLHHGYDTLALFNIWHFSAATSRIDHTLKYFLITLQLC